jgi:signal transduction histidine kinase
MSQSFSPPRLEARLFSQSVEEPLSPLASETANLRSQLRAQDKLVGALERRVARSLDFIQTHLGQLDRFSHDCSDWQKTLTSMAGELHQLSDLLSDATLLQKLEAGKGLVQLEAIDLPLLLDSVTRHLSGWREGSAPRLICTIPTQAPYILADYEHTEAVLMDLLGRALKYSHPDSTIVLKVNYSELWAAIELVAPQFAPAGQQDFAPEIALCCKRVEIQDGKVTCQKRSDGCTSIVINLRISDSAQL